MSEVAAGRAPGVATKGGARWWRWARRVWRAGVGVLAAIGAVTVARPWVFDLTPVASGSMAPTLQGDAKKGDWVLAEKVTYRFRAPRRWEVVEFQDEEGLQIMKRVAGLPGETVAVRGNRLEVNGRALLPPEGTARVTYYAYGNLIGGKERAVGNGYYVLGDDSIDSQDSRYEGSLARERIEARAWLIVWPPGRMGWVR